MLTDSCNDVKTVVVEASRWEDPACVPIAVSTGRPLRKVFKADGSAAKVHPPARVSLTHRRAETIYEMADLLREIEGRGDACVLRAAPVDPAQTRNLERRHKDRSGRRAPALKPCARSWVCFDVDDLPVPDSVWELPDEGGYDDGLPSFDLTANPRERAVRNFLLEEAFGFMLDVSCVVQWSSSAFMPAKGQTVSAHVWYCLSDPLTDEQLRFWLATEKAAGRCRWIDASLARAVQPHFTAAPDTADYFDPLPGCRTQLVTGMEDVFDVTDVLDAWEDHGAALEARRAEHARRAAERAGGHGDRDRMVAIEAVGHIDPDCDYDTWLRVGMALHSAFPEDGVELYDEWSAGAPSYVPGEPEAKWASFTATGGVGLGTLFRLAEELGGYKQRQGPPAPPLAGEHDAPPSDGGDGAGTTAPAPAARPRFQVRRRLDHDSRVILGVIRDVCNSRAGGRSPMLYRRSDDIVRVKTTPDGPVFSKVDGLALRALVSRVADFYMVKPQKDGSFDEIDVDCSRDTFDNALAAYGDSTVFPEVVGIRHVIGFDERGDVMDRPGYHDRQRVVVDPPHGRTLAIPDAPTPAQVREALDTIFVDWLGDFPFVDQASQANALALALAPMVRSMHHGNTPLHLVVAPMPRTGKTKLVECIALAHTAHAAHTVPIGKEDKDWQAQVTAALTSGPVMALLDNLPTDRTLDSASLASLFTSVRWEARRYGRNDEVLKLRNNTIWAATGNNPRLSSELTWRSMLIELSADCPNPAQRTGFRHDNLEGWTLQNAGRLVSALGTLVRAWVCAGMPAGSQRLGGFAEHVAIIGGILDVVGVPGFLGNSDKLLAGMDREATEAADFLNWWWHHAGGDNRTGRRPADLLHDMDHQGVDLLAEAMGPRATDRGRQTRLGLILRQWSGDGTLSPQVFQVGEDLLQVCRPARSKAGQFYYIKHISGPGTLLNVDADYYPPLPAKGAPESTRTEPVPSYLDDVPPPTDRDC
jgi:hypothetical protein